MGKNRGSKRKKREKLKWGNRKANSGRRPNLGKRPQMPKWEDVRRKMLAKATVIIVPKATDDATPAPAAAATATE